MAVKPMKNQCTKTVRGKINTRVHVLADAENCEVVINSINSQKCGAISYFSPAQARELAGILQQAAAVANG